MSALVEWLEILERQSRAIESTRLELLAAVLDVTAHADDRRSADDPVPLLGSNRELAYRAARAEIAVALRIGEHLVDRRLGLADTVVRGYPRVLRALGAGTISLQHAEVIAAAGTAIGLIDSPGSVERRGRYEEAVLTHAVHETPGRLRPIARGLAEAEAERPIEELHAESSRRRRVSIVDLEDGMADLVAYLPAVEAHAIFDRITRLAKRTRRFERDGVDTGTRSAAGPDPRETSPHGGPRHADFRSTGSIERSGPADRIRCIDQVRADTLSDLLLAADPAQANALGLDAVQARVQVIVHEADLSPTAPPRFFPDQNALDQNAPDQSSSDQPSRVLRGATLTGHGPIDSSVARRLAGGARTWERVTVHPRSGAVISVERYRPSEEIRRFLSVRDQHCRFPGCRVAVWRCDIDHTIDAAHGGATATDNLAALCRGHHTLKHQTGWSVVQGPGGALEWTSPTGRSTTDRPPSLVRFERLPDDPNSTEDPNSTGGRDPDTASIPGTPSVPDTVWRPESADPNSASGLSPDPALRPGPLTGRNAATGPHAAIDPASATASVAAVGPAPDADPDPP